MAVAAVVAASGGAAIALRRRRGPGGPPARPDTSHIELPDGVPVEVRNAIAEGLAAGAAPGSTPSAAEAAPAWISIPAVRDEERTRDAAATTGDPPASAPDDEHGPPATVRGEPGVALSGGLPG